MSLETCALLLIRSVHFPCSPTSVGLSLRPQLDAQLGALPCAFRSRPSRVHRVHRRPRRCMQTAGQLVEHVETAMVPAPLMAGRGIHVAESGPETEGSVAAAQQRRFREPTVAQLTQHARPRDGAHPQLVRWSIDRLLVLAARVPGSSIFTDTGPSSTLGTGVRAVRRRPEINGSDF